MSGSEVQSKILCLGFLGEEARTELSGVRVSKELPSSSSPTVSPTPHHTRVFIFSFYR